jgi:hypothetical protein
MDHAIIRPSQSLVKGGRPAAQFRLDDGAHGSYRTLTGNALPVEVNFPDSVRMIG